MGQPGKRTPVAFWLRTKVDLDLSADDRAEFERIMPTGWTDTILEARCYKRGCGMLGWWVSARPPLVPYENHFPYLGPRDGWRWQWFYPARHISQDKHYIWRVTKYGKEQKRKGIRPDVNWTWRPPETPDGPYELMPMQEAHSVLPTKVCCPKCREVNVVRPPWANQSGYVDPPWYTTLYAG